MHPTLRTLAVIGNGIIGHGIAEVFASAGVETILIGRSEKSLADAVQRIRTSRTEFARQGLFPEAKIAEAIARIRTSTRLDDAAEAELVIEAVPEDMELKLSIFERLDQITGPIPCLLRRAAIRPASSLSG